jgi:hypothetical protein
MWPWLFGFRCGRCRELHPRWHRALRSPLRPWLAICEGCLDAWERAGHRCARCRRPIRDRLEVGLRAETGAFLHVACGGARVLGTPIVGALDGSRPPQRGVLGRWVRRLG